MSHLRAPDAEHQAALHPPAARGFQQCQEQEQSSHSLLDGRSSSWDYEWPQGKQEQGCVWPQGEQERVRQLLPHPRGCMAGSVLGLLKSLSQHHTVADRSDRLKTFLRTNQHFPNFLSLFHMSTQFTHQLPSKLCSRCCGQRMSKYVASVAEPRPPFQG